MNFVSLKEQVRKLKGHTLTIYFAARDPEMPILLKFVALLVAAYALSPIDLIPDFIPVIGYLDDLIIVALGIALVIHFAPPEVMKSAQLKASQVVDKPVSYTAAAFFVIFWIMISAVFIGWVYRAVFIPL